MKPTVLHSGLMLSSPIDLLRFFSGYLNLFIFASTYRVFEVMVVLCKIFFGGSENVNWYT